MGIDCGASGGRAVAGYFGQISWPDQNGELPKNKAIADAADKNFSLKSIVLEAIQRFSR